LKGFTLFRTSYCLYCRHLCLPPLHSIQSCLAHIYIQRSRVVLRTQISNGWAVCCLFTGLCCLFNRV